MTWCSAGGGGAFSTGAGGGGACWIVCCCTGAAGSIMGGGSWGCCMAAGGCGVMILGCWYCVLGSTTSWGLYPPPPCIMPAGLLEAKKYGEFPLAGGGPGVIMAAVGGGAGA